ncbi:GIY-YIG nuclease family protein [Patescibacteria group bacterium]|nr:GIY-YIG nuclease family protein [Patescibacteria group bacterium]MBU1951642.1 GIY-YIG nuclease family protein [Patescibacteria group bacterium]
MKKFYIYILTNKTNKVLYIGVTNDLIRRIYEHRNNLLKGFTQKYNVHKLVYYEATGNVLEAISREKSMKRWKRVWKEKLINKMNPDWDDLYEKII